MAQIPDSASWAQAVAADLRRAAGRIADAPSPDHLGEERLFFATLKEEAGTVIDKLTASERIDRDRCLYVIRLDDQANPTALKSAFVKTKQYRDLKLPQVNNSVSGTLYVGTSCATHSRARTLRSRLKQHFIRAPTGNTP